MYITYHQLVEIQGEYIMIPHICLAKEIQDYLYEADMVQGSYMAQSNDYCLFLYLSHGDRVDIHLS